MNYRNRHLETKIIRYKEIFPVLLITGARQVGKSTLLGYLCGTAMPHITFEPVIDVGNRTAGGYQAPRRSRRCTRPVFHGPGIIVAPVEEVFQLRDEVLVVPYDLL